MTFACCVYLCIQGFLLAYTLLGSTLVGMSAAACVDVVLTCFNLCRLVRVVKACIIVIIV